MALPSLVDCGRINGPRNHGLFDLQSHSDQEAEEDRFCARSKDSYRLPGDRFETNKHSSESGLIPKHFEDMKTFPLVRRLGSSDG